MVRDAGGNPLLLTPDTSTEFIAQTCDGVVISGGDDVDSRHYGEVRREGLEAWIMEPDERYQWLSQLMPVLDQRRIPILGICYGMQFLNIYYGGTLYQDISMQLPEAHAHNQVLHDVVFTSTMLAHHANQRVVVNSRHHQAVRRLADGFRVTATAPDGLIEAMMNDHERYGLQWHAEADQTGKAIYGAFIERCTKYHDMVQ